MLIPVEVDVDNELRPVDSEAVPDCAVLIPVEAEVDSELRPVDSEVTPL